ncbi:MAG TPA: hypothetical protein VHX59_22450 [Mycobacteriales bacterium]|jgi:hypothetical protein|nr:hypothetical protein [Mycobacteriales bacterium]
MSDDEKLVEPEGVNASSADGEGVEPVGDVTSGGKPRGRHRSAEQPQPDELVGAPEQRPGKPGQQQQVGEG